MVNEVINEVQQDLVDENEATEEVMKMVKWVMKMTLILTLWIGSTILMSIMMHGYKMMYMIL